MWSRCSVSECVKERDMCGPLTLQCTNKAAKTAPRRKEKKKSKAHIKRTVTYVWISPLSLSIFSEPLSLLYS